MPFTEKDSFHFNFKTKEWKGSQVKSEALEFPTTILPPLKITLFKTWMVFKESNPYIQSIENERWGERLFAKVTFGKCLRVENDCKNNKAFS